MMKFRNGLLLGTMIQTTAGGPVTGGSGPLSVQTGGEVVSHQAATATATDAPVDPNAPVVEAPVKEKTAEELAAEANETPEQKTAREAAELAAKNETPEQKAARELAEKNTAWENRDKTKDVAVSTEQEAQIAAMGHLNDTQKAAIRDFTVEMNTTQDLTPASRAKAAELWGVDPQMVDAYVAGIKAQNARVLAEADKGTTVEQAPASRAEMNDAQRAEFDTHMKPAYDLAGGTEAWFQFGAWATGGGLTEAQQVELSKAFDVSGAAGAALAKGYVDAWKAQGNDTTRVDLSKGSAVQPERPVDGPKGFGSTSEQNEALNKTDSNGRRLMDVDLNYRQTVEQRMAVSDFSKSAVEKSFFAGAMMSGKG